MVVERGMAAWLLGDKIKRVKRNRRELHQRGRGEDMIKMHNIYPCSRIIFLS